MASKKSGVPEISIEEYIAFYYKKQEDATDTAQNLVHAPKSTRAQELADDLSYEILTHPFATFAEKLEAGKLIAWILHTFGE